MQVGQTYKIKTEQTEDDKDNKSKKNTYSQSYLKSLITFFCSKLKIIKQLFTKKTTGAI